MKKLVQQLRHRNVLKAALSYLVAGWVILQVGDLIFPLFGFSESVLQIVLIILIVAFPVWVFLVYKYEWSSEGLKESVIDPAAPQEKSSTKWTAFIITGMAIAITLLVVDRIFYFTRPEIVKDPPDIKSITTTRSYKYSSTWSPDGSLMAYAEFQSSFDLMLTTPDVPSSNRKLTNHPADELLSRWSNDGSKIAFITDRGSGVNVYWLPPAGGPERLIASTNLHALEHFYELLASLGVEPWSPDDQKFLFPKLIGNTISIWQYDFVTGEEQQVTHPSPGQKDLSASWSKDGTNILFQRGSNIWIKPTDGREYEVLQDNYINYQPLWSSDPNKILFISSRSGSPNIWQLSLIDETLEQVTFLGSSFYTWEPSLSNNGRLAFTQFAHDTDLELIDLETQQKKRLTYHIGENFHPTFSVDGKKIMYQSNRTGNFEIWLLDLQSEQEIQLTDNPGQDIKPDLSPDGSKFAFLSNRTGEYHLWVADIKTGKPIQTTSEPVILPNFLIEYSLTVSWSPHGNLIGYMALGEKDRALWVINEDGSNNHIIIENIHSFDWYLNDTMIVYNRIDKGDNPSAGLWIHNLKTGKEKLLYSGHMTEVFSKRDGTGIGFAYSESHWAQGLYVLDVDPENRDENGFPKVLGSPKRLTEENVPWHAHFGSWSPDGNKIVFVRDLDEGNIVEITNKKF